MAMSNAQRQKAHRERKARELAELVEQGGRQAQADSPAEPVSTSPSPPSSLPDLEVYVAEAVTAAEIAFSQASPNANLSTKELGETLERAESYARWRYAGVLDGSIGSL